jgi:hypothetical protein
MSFQNFSKKKGLKKMKKTTKLLSLLLCLILAISLMACGTDNSEDDTPKSPDASVTLVFEDSSDGIPNAYEVTLSNLSEGDGIIPLLRYVCEKNGLDFNMREDGVIEKIAHLENDYVNNSYIYIFTSVDTDKDVSAYRSTVTYNGVTLTSSGVGATDMHLEDGAIIYIGLVTFSF